MGCELSKYLLIRVVYTLVHRTSIDKGTVEYVSFGSCEKFQDLVIIAKVLSEKPGASLAIHLIDQQYAAFTDSRLQLGLSSEIQSDESDDIQFDASAIAFFKI